MGTCLRVRVLPVLSLMYRAINSFRPEGWMSKFSYSRERLDIINFFIFNRSLDIITFSFDSRGWKLVSLIAASSTSQ